VLTFPPGRPNCRSSSVDSDGICKISLFAVAGDVHDGIKKEEEEEDAFVSPIINREVQISVQAPWPSSPHNVLCEAHAFWSSFFFQESSSTKKKGSDPSSASSSWTFLDQLAIISPVSIPTYQGATQVALEVSQHLDQNETIPLLQWALTLRAQSPTCELHRTLGEEYRVRLQQEHQPKAFVVLGDGQVYSDPSLLPPASTVASSSSSSDARQQLLPNETPRGTGPLAILYAQLGGLDFKKWYEVLTSPDDTHQYSWVVRHGGGGSSSSSPDDEGREEDSFTALQGYGVRLDIRNVEYKVFNDEKTGTTSTDDNTKVAVDSLSSLTSEFLAGVNLTALGWKDDNLPPDHLQATLWKKHQAQQQQQQLIPPAWQRRQLGLQAATVIANLHKQDNDDKDKANANTLLKVHDTLLKVHDELMLLQEVSQNLPSVASTLVHIPVPEDIQKVTEKMEQVLHSLIRQSGGGLFINGKALDVERGSFNVFEMIERLTEEQGWLHKLQDLPVTNPAALEELQQAWMKGEDFFEGTSSGGGSGGSSHMRINVQEGENGAVLYLNDIEKDDVYSRWPTRLDQALMAMQYGMPPTVRRNLFTILLVENPLDLESSNMGRDLGMQFLQGQYPVRMALLVVDDKELEDCKQWIQTTKPAAGIACPAREDSWLDKKHAPSSAELMKIKATPRDLHQLYSYVDVQYDGQREIFQAYEHYFGSSLRRKKPANGQYVSVFDLFQVHVELMMGFQLARQQQSPVDVAMELLKLNKKDCKADYYMGLRFAVDKGLKSGMGFLNGRPIPQGDDISDAVGQVFMEEQQFIFQMIAQRQITESTPRNLYRKILSNKAKNVYPKLHPLFSAGADGSYLDWIPDDDSAVIIPTTMTGMDPLAQEAIVLVGAVFRLDTELGKQLEAEFITAMNQLPLTIEDKTIALAYRIQQSPDERNFVVANGRYYSLEESQSIDASDLELLISIHLDHVIPVTKMLKKSIDPKRPYDAISRATAFLSASKSESGRRWNPMERIMAIERKGGLQNNPLRFSWNGDCAETGRLKMNILAVVDPVTESAQRLSPLLQILRDKLKLPLTVILAPTTEIDSESKIPITSYYRFVADSNVYQRGDERHSPMAHFSNLPVEHILTVHMDVPEPWDIQQTASIQDTDNLRCSLQSGCSDDATSGNAVTGSEMWKQRHLTRVQYGLEHLLFAGQCYETDGSHPNGLQLTLSKHADDKGGDSETVSMEIGPDGTMKVTDQIVSASSTKHYSDTLVMKNVGYWQLRANPGIWDLNLLEGSRGNQIFDIVEGVLKGGSVKVQGKKLEGSRQLIMGDFVNKASVLVVQRKEGFHGASLFSDIEVSTSEEDVVHVFSLATGHLYERLLKIMMLSVTKRTSSKVKFWLFENFLSPTFKNSAKAMADKIGCEVEFVTYKWPEWLRGQTEKQRIIWGYKILFLDVLFPLNVKKIIYVDADQVVRGDLTELRDMDLQGAPYGYTPMCDSRETTIGYAFWKTGFWESHLRGKPYHISALYVVDLEQFRKTLVGDNLRSVYQSLSADPNSLANLDQDLPNFAQHQVPIFSLPQEWLWCESWCSDETKPAAKTIDLCNNPLHKEPKLSMAKRVISGELFEESWEELDLEVKKYEAEYFNSLASQQ